MLAYLMDHIPETCTAIFRKGYTQIMTRWSLVPSPQSEAARRGTSRASRS